MRRFAQLFAGRTDCWGRYTITEQRTDGKKKGRGHTVREPLTGEVFASHLSGQLRVGVVPIKLDGTVSWFAGDIDKYGLDIIELEKRVQKAGLPLVVCRSKSGGAHLYCFLRSGASVSATVAIPVMKLWLKTLGYDSWLEGVRRRTPEVFPKQETVSEESTGNWINLPYHGASATSSLDAYALGLNGERLDLEDFERLAEARSATPEDLRGFLDASQKPRKDRDPLDDAPPCVQRMFKEGITEGGRNNAMTHIGIYYLKSDPDNYQGRIYAANHNYFSPPLDDEEMRIIVRNVSKSKYEYLCKQPPMCDICDRDTCMTRKWGVGPQQGIDYQPGDIDRIIKIDSDPPIYLVIMNGTPVKMTTEMLLSPTKFRRRVFEITGHLIAPVKERQHEARIQAVRTDVEAAPKEVSEEGQIIEAFEEWCEIHIPNARSLAEVRRGNPYYDRESRRIVFRASDLIAAFKRRSMFNVADRDVWAALRSRGCARENVRINTDQTKVWVYPVDKPWFEIPTEEAF